MYAPAPSAQEAVAPTDGPFSTILNKNFGESAKLAAALGLPPDFSCPVCRSGLVLRLWVDASTDAGVTGHFFCPGCTQP